MKIALHSDMYSRVLNKSIKIIRVPKLKKNTQKLISVLDPFLSFFSDLPVPRRIYVYNRFQFARS